MMDPTLSLNEGEVGLIQGWYYSVRSTAIELELELLCKTSRFYGPRCCWRARTVCESVKG